MRRQKRQYLFFILFSVLCLIFLDSKAVSAADVSLNFKTKTITTDSKGFYLKVRGGEHFKFYSSNPKVATVMRNNGKVKPVAPGKTIITARKGSKKLKCRVYVVQPIDVFVFAGQSNMMGAGDSNLAPDLIDGAGYAYYPVTNKNVILTIHENKGQPFGLGQDDKYLNNTIYPGVSPRGSLVTAFINAYYEKTKVPVLAIPATEAGTGSGAWIKSKYQGVVQRTNNALLVAKKHGLAVRHVYMVWLQGENDAFAFMTADEHSKNMKTLYKKIHKATPIEKIMVINIPPYYGKELTVVRQENYSIIQNSYRKICKTNKNFVMISDVAPTFPEDYMYGDGLHVQQYGLNILGTDAGTRAGNYVNKLK